MLPFRIAMPEGQEVPIVVSVPHCGTHFPADLEGSYVQSLIRTPDDTDWFVDTLYDFAPAMGMTMISAVYSRWVIDLNRDPDSKPLYNDGRIITALCPATTFLGESLYRDGRKEVSVADVADRKRRYFAPYHHELELLLAEKIRKFGRVLLWDCHSIRRSVPTIQKDPFPDLILGSADGISASPGLIETALSSLEHSEWEVRHNHPFKGGYITRHYGKPTSGSHALQLEMSKVNYMDDAEREYHPVRAGKMRQLLQQTFERLISQLA